MGSDSDEIQYFGCLRSKHFFYRSHEMVDYLPLAEYKVYDHATLLLEMVDIKQASSKLCKNIREITIELLYQNHAWLAT